MVDQNEVDRAFEAVRRRGWDAGLAKQGPFEDPPLIGAGIYVISGWQGELRYVGSTVQAGGLGNRLAQHRLNPAKANKWHWVTVLPLFRDVPDDVARCLEGLVARRLGGQRRLIDQGALPAPDCAIRRSKWLSMTGREARAFVARRRPADPEDGTVIRS